MKIINDFKGSLPIRRIVDENYEYSFGYYTNNEWVDKTRLVLARNPKDGDKEFIGTSELVLIDIEKETEKLLCTAEEYGRYASDYVVHGTKVYYTAHDNCLYSLDVETLEKKLLHEEKVISHPHMTRDGKYINFTVYPEDTTKGMFSCVVINLETGEKERVFETRFSNPLPEADHMMICPTDKNKVFFAHEGNTHYVSNRLWLWERGKGLRNLAKQKLDENGNLGDCFGHECWEPDGKGMYYVKYPCSPVLPTGLCYVSLDGEQTEVMYDKYLYWHVCASPDGKYLASDTTGREAGDPEFSRVCLINRETGEEKELLKAYITWRHPCHPHPKFTPDTKQMMYHELYEGRTCVNFIDLDQVI